MSLSLVELCIRKGGKGEGRERASGGPPPGEREKSRRKRREGRGGDDAFSPCNFHLFFPCQEWRICPHTFKFRPDSLRLSHFFKDLSNARAFFTPNCTKLFSDVPNYVSILYVPHPLAQACSALRPHRTPHPPPPLLRPPLLYPCDSTLLQLESRLIAERR